MISKLYKYIGVIFTVIVTSLFYMSIIPYKPLGFTIIYCMLIIFSTYMGGILSSVSSAAIGIFYLHYLMKSSGEYIDLAGISYSQFFISVTILLCVALPAIIGELRYKKCCEKCKELHMLASKAEEISGMMICRISAKGKYLKVHPKLCNLLGYTEEELLKMQWWDITEVDDALTEEMFIGEIISGKRNSYCMEKKLRKKSWDTVWVFSNVAAVRNSNNEIIYLLNYMVDITEQKTIKTELARSKKELTISRYKYKYLMDIVPHAVIIHENNIITFINKTGLNMLKASANEEVIGRSIYEFVNNEYIDYVKSQVNRALNNTGCPGNPYEIKVSDFQGKNIDIEIINIGFKNEGRVQVMAVLRDISEKKKTEKLKIAIEKNEKELEEAKEYDRIKNEFFANLSHEFRTPLNVLMGTLQLLDIQSKKEDKNCDSIEKYVSIMKKNCYRLLKLVNNLIDITQIDLGHYHMKVGYYDIVKIIKNIVFSTVPYVNGKGLSIEFDSNVEEKIISCDAEQIERIMLNLISNAIKFTRTGGKIEVYIKDMGNTVKISVKDTGIGIPEEKQHIIFERFRQIDKSLTRENEGSGIGLSIVKSLVELHKGKIYLISQQGCGSEFIVELPVKLGQKDGPHSSGVVNKEDIEKINIEFSDIYF